MGCCLSTTTNKTSKTNPDVPPNHRHHFPESNPNGRALPPPPPSPLEEETVKEVLSETPIPKPPPIPTANDSNKKKNPQQQQQPVVGEVKIEPTAVIKPAEEIVSEVSEMYSFSESFSTVTEKREDDGEVTQQVHRSPSKVPRKRPISGDLARRKEKGGRSPARRSEPSPVKRTQVTSRSVQGRTMMNTPRNVGPPKTFKRDPGECSGRMSRSPVTRGEAEPRWPLRYRSPALTQAGRSGVRKRAATAASGGETEKLNDEVSPEGTTESLENPLVSLECFIFL